MFGKRPDGRRIRNLAPIDQIMPYIMKDRHDSMNMYDDYFDCTPIDAYIKEKSAEGIKLNYMHIYYAAMVRLIALRPKLNRFVMNGKIYARPKIWISITLHHALTDDDVETTIKLCFDGTENIFEVAEKLDEAIKKETTEWKGTNGIDDLLFVLMKKIPGPLIRFVVNTLMWMDRHNIMPKKIVELSPFHTSIFITNLKSLGINHIFHHVYNFGTTGLFLAMGKEKKMPVVEGNEVVIKKMMSFGLVSDERFCDGLYFAKSLRMLRRIMKNPKVLEEKLDHKIEDID